MLVDMVECDNPACDNTAGPERVKGRKYYTGPYGWFQLLGEIVGTGPGFRVDACSDECVGPAVLNQLRRAGDRDLD
jgi:hypothetical protein